MDAPPRDVLVGAVVSLATGLALWPPGAVYWTAVAGVLGETVTVAAVFLLAAGIGGLAADAADLTLAGFAVGGAGAYLLGVGALELATEGVGIGEVAVYGGVLACTLVGAAFGAAEG